MVPPLDGTKTATGFRLAYTFRWIAAFLLLLQLPGPAAKAAMPSGRGLPDVTTVYGGGLYPANGFSAMCVACHTRNPSPRDNVSPAPATDHYGSHFVFGGVGVLPTGNTATWEKIDAWPVTGAFSRYGDTGGSKSSVTNTTGELICESCHNLLRNTGRYKIVVTDNATTDPSPLCEGCHGRTGPGHHLLTNDLSSLHPGVMNNADSPFVRNPPLASSEVAYPGANQLNCRSCHGAHNAWTVGGARVLRRGWRSSDGSGVAGVAATGIERSSENPVNAGSPVVTDYEPLCNACHKVGY